jgi:carboxypeptidase C (cathepsin A)
MTSRICMVLALSLAGSPVGFAQQQNPSRPESVRPPAQTTKSPGTPPPPEKTAAPSQERREAPPQPRPQPEPREEAPGPGGAGPGRSFHFDMTEHPPVVTHHQITVAGKLLKYTATAGRLPIRDMEGRIQAEMFFVAYTLDGVDPSRRPVTFSYNGGPGSASLWLHMGALGPRIVAMEPEGFMPQSPYHLIDNPDTPLDRTDIVMVDAVGTGYSRPADQNAARHYWSLRGDVEAFGEFIRSYISTYDRWSSPLYLLGESYGTTRSAGLAGYLFDRGINFNGICLLSTVLNFETLVFSPQNDVPYPLILPTYTMIAAYHHKLPLDLMQNLDKTRQDAINFAMGDYWNALNKGDALTAQERAAIVDKVAMYTGLPKNIVDLANMRIDVPTFTKWLLADEKLRVGRLDGRYKSPDPQPWISPFGFSDPTSSATQGPFTMMLNHYLRTELDYKVDMPYYTSAQESGVFNWSFTEPGGAFGRGGFNVGYPETSSSLREAITQDPYLKVLVMEGYYDLATPFLGADYTMDHLDLLPQYRKNISYAQYYSGHMVYLDQKSHAKMKTDYEHFIDATSKK